MEIPKSHLQSLTFETVRRADKPFSKDRPPTPTNYTPVNDTSAYRTRFRPPTPYPMAKTKRQCSVASSSSSSEPLIAKKRKLSGSQESSTLSQSTAPRSVLPSDPIFSSGITLSQIKTASQSALEQVDWSEVILDVTGREKPSILRQVFQQVLEAGIKHSFGCTDSSTSLEVECGSGSEYQDIQDEEYQDVEDSASDDEDESTNEEDNDDLNYEVVAKKNLHSLKI